jgi:hypothetical protein
MWKGSRGMGSGWGNEEVISDRDQGRLMGRLFLGLPAENIRSFVAALLWMTRGGNGTGAVMWAAAEGG